MRFCQIIPFFMVLAGTSLPAFAVGDCEPNSIQCLSITGLPQESTNGRYIKIALINDNQNIYSVKCDAGVVQFGLTLNDIASISLSGDETTETVSICKDAIGADCQLIGATPLRMMRNSTGSYSVMPSRSHVDVSAYIADPIYPACTVKPGNKHKIVVD